jgi:hypothetical protein
MTMMERLEKAGLRKYADAARNIKEHEGWQFETPKHRDIKIKGQFEIRKSSIHYFGIDWKQNSETRELMWLSTWFL